MPADFMETTETIEIYGKESQTRLPFSLSMRISFDPRKVTPEQALINTFGSPARNFAELAVLKGWSDADWTYAGCAGVPVSYAQA